MTVGRQGLSCTFPIRAQMEKRSGTVGHSLFIDRGGTWPRIA